jgi:MoaA/NifB/PqqE/SkfB family radical SAM enzyme
MLQFNSLEPAIDPANRIAFLLDWELTMKCNLDCSYCDTGIDGGHDNSTQHPPLDDCLKTIDFMFEYVDLYMQHKPKGIRYVILNVYGGESLHHPDIVEILQAVHDRYNKYRNAWHLTVTTTTNAILSKKKLQHIIPLIDEFTVSYHSEHTEKQQTQFKDNLLTITKSKARLKCVVLMHAVPKFFQKCLEMIQWIEQHGIKYLPRQLDHGISRTDLNYNKEQVVWLDNLYAKKSYQTKPDIGRDTVVDSNNNLDLASGGRACCGGRQLCQDSNYKSRSFWVGNKFPDWYCSVNHFFLFVKQVNGKIYVNKDCKMNFDGQIGPIGTLDHSDELLSQLRTQIDSNCLPIIQCKKSSCYCGLCAPKAKNLDTFNKIMEKYYL